MEKYGNAASEEEIPRELLLGQSERQVEYDRAGRIIKGQVNIETTISFFFCYR
jgi:pre-mRNA-processing factor SLU7